MRSVIETLDGWLPCDSPRRAMRWVPPEVAVVERTRLGADVPKRVDLRAALSTECDDQPSGDDLQPRADTTPTLDASTQTLTKVGHVE